MHCGHDGVYAEVGHATVRAFAANGNAKLVARGHDRASGETKVTDGQTWPVMHTKDGLHGKFFKQAIFHHAFGACSAFFGRLKNDVNSTIEIFMLGQVAGRTQQHGRVTVMATTMHFAGMLAGMLKGVELLHRKRIEIRAQTDRAVAGRTTLDDADDARTA